MEVLYDLEDKDGVRFTWNVWPANKQETGKNIVPVGCCYTPLKKGTHVQTVPYPPLNCATCKVVLNPYWYVKAIIIIFFKKKKGEAFADVRLCCLCITQDLTI